MALPERILTNLIDGLDKLNLVVPGVSNDETLLYAPEIKFFATQIETDNDLETRIPGLYRRRRRPRRGRQHRLGRRHGPHPGQGDHPDTINGNQETSKGVIHVEHKKFLGF